MEEEISKKINADFLLKKWNEKFYEHIKLRHEALKNKDREEWIKQNAMAFRLIDVCDDLRRAYKK